eukprot:CAMPEP_0170167570 /NCGR_PEP_ID=MMETSP0040_2-20121228/946_1 /TAXON_ID=641309 /ORGANISM="Lotharella oceanica, Strain CCMP622" /LENGTH=216 /DNA_ID=CAMNT_0010405651 /DNA_START=27 /DNA_END=678 /DNA_ORIENTATION=+
MAKRSNSENLAMLLTHKIDYHFTIVYRCFVQASRVLKNSEKAQAQAQAQVQAQAEARAKAEAEAEAAKAAAAKAEAEAAAAKAATAAPTVVVAPVTVGGAGVVATDSKTPVTVVPVTVAAGAAAGATTVTVISQAASQSVMSAQGNVHTNPAVVLVPQAHAVEVPKVPLVVTCTMSVIVPEGVAPGTKIKVTIGAQELEVAVPDDAIPGNVLQICA